MSVNFSKSRDRNLRAFQRPQRIVRNCLTYGTRYTCGPDDSDGRVHRAAIGGSRHIVHALTFLEPAADLNRDLLQNFCVIYVELDSETFAVFLGVDNPSLHEGREYAATGIMKLPGLPACLTRSSSFVARDSGSSLPRAANDGYAPMHDASAPVASSYSLTPGRVRDRDSPPSARPSSDPRALYGTPLPAP